MEDNCKDCKHYIETGWEEMEWMQCDLQDLAWKYENCPFGKKKIKQLREAKESCLQTLKAIENKIAELEQPTSTQSENASN